MSKFEKNISTIINGLIEYHDLGYILNNLEKAITLPTPYKNPNVTSEQYEDNMEIASQIQSESMKNHDEFSKEYDLRKTTFEAIKKQYPKFCNSIARHLDSDAHKQYLLLYKKCSRDIEDLILSLQKRKNDYNELLMDKKDFISNVIDSENNSELTFMQDEFVLSEFDNIDIKKFDSEIQDNIKRIIEDLKERISKYNTFKKLYSSENQIKIKPSKNSFDEERV